jgi:hypothetical protein
MIILKMTERRMTEARFRRIMYDNSHIITLSAALPGALMTFLKRYLSEEHYLFGYLGFGQGLSALTTLCGLIWMVPYY